MARGNAAVAISLCRGAAKSQTRRQSALATLSSLFTRLLLADQKSGQIRLFD